MKKNLSIGRFITLEGIEGTGKSTLITYVAELLEQQGQRVQMTREPGGTSLGEKLRSLLLFGETMHTDTELLLMFAARAEHWQTKILPALSLGEWVICDRFTDATYAYQGAGRGIEQSRIAVLENWVQGECRPDLTLLLDTPAAIGMARAAARQQIADRFEQEKLAFFERVRAGYRQRAACDPQRYRIIDATPPLANVSQAIKTTLLEYVQRID